jgi:hypothetical protein
VTEQERLEQARSGTPWRKWGPYLSERQWGTVREDYSQNGDAWNYFSHDQARSRAYRWGEDGIAGISDHQQRLCFALALWNGNDPILKERLFGLNNSEGNHGEDVKEYYFYLDSTPTHAYMKYLYKYPQAAYPYNDLVETNRSRGREAMEYELLDTGIFDGDRYFDVFVEYAKADTDDLLIKITAFNRGPEPAELRVLPTLWFRNDWASWLRRPAEKPELHKVDGPSGTSVVAATHPNLGTYYLACDGAPPLLFTDNETNNARLFADHANASPYVKDGINDHVIHGAATVNPAQVGTKVSAHYQLSIGGGQSATVRLRLSDQPVTVMPFGASFDETFATRLGEADAFYAALTPPGASRESANVMRQALAGMLWSKQHYSFDADQWLDEHDAHPLRHPTRSVRNEAWMHMVNDDVISMPDKWEYPWYAAWDLAFHTLALGVVDRDFARQQLALMLRARYVHPSGQIPAYEWNFGDVNPPVHAWATMFLHRAEQALDADPDIEFLRAMFNKLALNFTWWVNRKDRDGRNVFEGGFLGLDNIGIFDRSSPLPTGGYLEQADGTAWMALFSQNMTEIANELAAEDPVYEDMVLKFVEHFLFIAAAMNGSGADGMWDDEDGFYYDLLRLPDGSAHRLKVRSLVGLLPLCATTVIEAWQRERTPIATQAIMLRLNQMPELAEAIHPTGPGELGVADRGILALVNPDRLRRILTRMLDESEFFGPFGIRSVSRYHADHPYTLNVGGQEYRVDYLPAESNTGMFGGNSNWRGPVWMPINALLIRALTQFYLYYGDNLKVECPTGSGNLMNLFEVSQELANRLTRIFLPDERGRRPVYGGTERFQSDPHWRDYVLFHEYFHGDNGAGLGASHQTGWTGVIAAIMQIYGRVSAQHFLEVGASPGRGRANGAQSRSVPAREQLLAMGVTGD